MSITLFDCIIAPTLILLAWLALHTKDLFVGVVFFILFGLLAALAWVELKAPDIALVEAAIGAGVTGALFLGSLGVLEKKKADSNRPGERKMRSFLGISVLALAGIFCWSIYRLPIEMEGIGPWVYRSLPESGGSNPVTAVILNFRGYDTLLEVGVLFLAAVATVALRYFEPASIGFHLPPNNPVLLLFLHLLLPSVVVAAAYLLWQGADNLGGAFQAGAILAAGGILLILAKVPLPLHYHNVWFRLAAVSGFAGFILTGAAVMGKSRQFLEFPPAYAKWIILLIELLTTISTGIILLTLFSACACLLGQTKGVKNGTD